MAGRGTISEKYLKWSPFMKIVSSNCWTNVFQIQVVCIKRIFRPKQVDNFNTENSYLLRSIDCGIIICKFDCKNYNTKRIKTTYPNLRAALNRYNKYYRQNA